MTTLQQNLQKNFPNLSFKFDYSLKQQSYFKVGGPAEAYLELKDKEEIAKIVKFCNQNSIKLTIFGGGSNVIVADEGVKGLVLKLTNSEFKHELRDQKDYVYVGAGQKTSLLVRDTLNLELTGLEFFLGVPGNVGGAVFNNAHYLDDLISDNIEKVEVVNKNGEITWLDVEECEFAYDSSRFHKTKEVILGVVFQLRKGNKEESQELVKKATLYRAKTQPLGIPSSGCIFQNVPNNSELKELFPQFAEKEFVPGGFLIDQAGLKGKTIGGVEVSQKHAAFFVNHGKGTSADIQQLIEIVKQQVKDKFNVELREEVFWLR